MSRIIGQKNLNATKRKLQTAITKAVWKNENLRSEFVRNPKATIEKELGVQFESDINVKCIDATDPHTFYLVLPHHPSKALGVEFTDEQLDAVAGGSGFNISELGTIIGDLGGLFGSGGSPGISQISTTVQKIGTDISSFSSQQGGQSQQTP